MSKGRIKTTETRGSTLPEIGKIKIGIKVKTSKGTEYPKAVDYFVPKSNYEQMFKQIYGDKPNQLNVAFISDNIEEVCNHRFEAWDKGKRFGHGDGVTFTVWDGTKYVEEGKDGVNVKKYGKLWKEMLTLRFVLLGMKGILGYWTFQTNAVKGSIPTIVNAFDMVREKAGTIIGFPFTLSVAFRNSYGAGETKKYPVITLVPNFTDQAIEEVRGYLQGGGNANLLSVGQVSRLELGSGDVQEVEVIDG